MLKASTLVPGTRVLKKMVQAVNDIRDQECDERADPVFTSGAFCQVDIYPHGTGQAAG